jgi:hypothetical protein
LWTLLVLTLGLLAWLHPRLDDLIDLDASRILDRSRFRQLHRVYLHISTVQWAVSLILTATTLLAWRCEDKLHAANKAEVDAREQTESISRGSEKF